MLGFKLTTTIDNGSRPGRKRVNFRFVYIYLLYLYNNHEYGVSDSNLFIHLILYINLQCLYTTNL